MRALFAVCGIFFLQLSAAAQENSLESLERAMSVHSRGAGSAGFGTWELHGTMRPTTGGVLGGEDMRCRLGAEPFLCDARLMIETNTLGVTAIGMEVRGEDVPLSALIPGDFKELKRFLTTLPNGSGHAMLIGTRDAGESRTHYFFSEWSARPARIHPDNATLPGALLLPMIAKMPFPYRDDLRAREFQLTEATARVRYYPEFYTPETARQNLGSADRLDETVLSLEFTIVVPRRFLFISTPHKYTLTLSNIPVRSFTARAQKADAARLLEEFAR